MSDLTAVRENRSGTWYLVWQRSFRASIGEVWAAVTEPQRLQRWIGTWTGDPASGQVLFTMTAEGEDVPPEIHRICECEPPRRLVVETASGPDAWRLELDLVEFDGVTTLTFAQPIDDPELAGQVGPGWEYYLDRLVAAESGADDVALAVAGVVWEFYYPRLSGSFSALVAEPG
ncbi:MAG: SRPBCC domain-containing protein [Actinomycetales bacterium]